MPEKISFELLRPMLERNLEILEREFPTMFWVPNIAQERALAPWSKPPYPFAVVCTYANGTGKTNGLVQDIAATCLGPEYVANPWVSDRQYYRELAPLREQGKLHCRLTADADDIQEGGPLFSEIKDWIPSAQFSGKSSGGVHKILTIPWPSDPNVKNTVEIKTFGQPAKSHAGSNLHRIWINEPPPQDVFEETIGRTRSKKGSPSTHILVFATVVDDADYIYDYLEDPEFKDRILHLQGSTWENCVGEEVPEDVGRKLGLQRAIAGGFITRGVLARASIENMIAVWSKRAGMVDARIWGLPQSIGGAIYKTFDSAIHVIKPYQIPHNAKVIQVVDPHDSSPDLSGWFMVTAQGKLKAIAEWPTRGQWESVRGRDLNIAATCEAWVSVEAELGLEHDAVTRVGDPNKFNDPDPNTLQTLQQLYAEHGFTFNTTINDDMEFGHREVETVLWYDRDRWEKDPRDPRNVPGFQVFETCPNIHRHMQKYGYVKKRDATAAWTDQVSQKFKGGADLVRYAVLALKQMSDAGGGNPNNNMSDFDRIQLGRDPYRTSMSANLESAERASREVKFIKGRRVVQWVPR
jgi:phage terminase large subunit-like protein